MPGAMGFDKFRLAVGQCAGFVEDSDAARFDQFENGLVLDNNSSAPAREIEPMMATGSAIKSGHGVATTKTARKREASPVAVQAIKAMATRSA